MRGRADHIKAAGLIVSLIEVLVGAVAIGTIHQLDRLAAVQRQTQAITLARHHLSVALEALGFLLPVLGAFALVVLAERTVSHARARRLAGLRSRTGAAGDRGAQNKKLEPHRAGFSMVSRLIDRKVASAISSISVSTRSNAPPISV